MARSISAEKLPEGWSYGLLDDFSVRCSGHTPSKSHPEYWNGGIKWISLADSHRLDKGYVFETDNEISLEGVKNSSAEIHPAETVVLSRDAGIGKSGVMAEPMAVSQHFIAWICDNKNQLHSWFLYSWLQQHKQEFERQAVGSTIKTIGLPYFKKLKIALPPFPEQKKIAQILSTWDQAITATERLLENSQQRKKGLMQQLLTGKKRLPGFEGEWSYQEIGKFLIESRIQSDSNDPSKRLTVRLNLKGIEQREVRGTEAKGSTAHYVRLAGQFIYWKQNIHKAAFGLIPEKFDKFETSQDLPAFDFKEGVDSHWFLYFCSQEWFYTDLEKKMTGTGSKRLNPKAFLKVKLPTPSFDEQRAIAEVLDLASRDIDAIKTKLELLQNEKKALMQQLLTGKRRVNVETEAA